MSRSTQVRKMDSHVYVYNCDRCGIEMAPTSYWGEKCPGEGARLAAYEYQMDAAKGWLPLREHDPEDRHDIADAANVDLCPSCLASLLVWFQAGPDTPEDA